MPESNCVCKTCGVSFYCKPSQIRLRNAGKYCSRACRDANPESRILRGPDNPSWKGDEASVAAGRTRAQRIFALGACEGCGAPAVDRHHVDGDTRNNEPTNVQTLCRRCHMERDGRLSRLRMTQSRKLTAKEAAEIASRYIALERPGRSRPRGSVAALALEYGVTVETVRLIGVGERWGEAS